MIRQKKKRIHRSTVNNATKKGHIHKHKPTWLPRRTRSGKPYPAKTHAWYRRQNQIPPSRLKKETNEQPAKRNE